MSKTLEEVRVSGGRGLDLAKVVGKDLFRIEGRSSSEFDQPALCARAINGQARARVNSRARLR